MKNKLIVSDLDGTLLNNNHEISKTNQEWVQKFRSAGGLFTFATGRMENSALPYAELLGVDIPIISYNGARIYCPTTRKILYDKNLIVPSEIWDIINSTNEEKGVFLYSEGKPFVLERNQIVKEFENKEKVQCILHKGDSLTDKPLTKILIIMNDTSELYRLSEGIENNGFNCEIVFSEINYLEILPAGVSKGKGLTKLINFLEIETPIHTIAIGDNLNDISLLKAADQGIAVGNARDELKAIADIVLTQSNEENAVATVIQSYEDKILKI